MSRVLYPLRRSATVIMGVTLVVILSFSGLGAAHAAATGSSVQATATFTSAPAPTITGTAVVGGRLQVTAPRWTPTATRTTYAWFSGGILVPGKAATSYVVQASDAGKAITVQVTGTRTGLAGLTKSSGPTVTIPTPVLKPFVKSAVPTVSGTVKIGSTLTAKAGVWSPVGAYSYQWLRNGSPVPGRTASTYRIDAADAGTKISVSVAGAKTGYATTSKTSAILAVPGVPIAPVPVPTPTPVPVPSPTVPVKVPFESSPKPVLSGASSVGSTVTANVSAWRPADAHLEYAWWVNNAKIANESSASYVLRATDLGKKVTVTVTGSKSGYVTAAATSAGLLVTPGVTPAPSPAPVGEGYDVVMIMGQSNAQGGGLGYDPAIDVTVPGLYQLAGSGSNKGKIVPASDSLNHVTTWMSDGAPRVGPGMEFGRNLIAANPNRKVLLVPTAQGSTALLKAPYDPTNPQTYIWNPTPDGADEMKLENLYTRAQSQLDIALATPGSRLVAVIWAQGETDTGIISRLPANEQTAAKAIYQTRLLEVIDGMNARHPDVPFLIGGMVPEWVAETKNGQGFPTRKMINQVHQSIGTIRKNVTFVAGQPGAHNTENLAEELLHYSAAGARQMGDKYYAAYVLARGAR
jgi:hypothetical protein